MERSGRHRRRAIRVCGVYGLIHIRKLDENDNYVLEIVIDGIKESDIKSAMKVGIDSILKSNCKEVTSISAGNYGGKLGPYLFWLKKVLK